MPASAELTFWLTAPQRETKLIPRGTQVATRQTETRQAVTFATDADFAPLNEQEYDECLAQMPAAVAAVAHYWIEQPPTVEELAGRGFAGL